jgi:dolichol-phosphate mannosyltransferase
MGLMAMFSEMNSSNNGTTKTNNMKNLSIVIPAYNEEKTIYTVLDQLHGFFCNIDFEIIVVNDASTDKTLSILKKYQKETLYLKILNNKENLGHARSLLKGLKAATGEYVLYMDADNQILPTLYPSIYFLTSGYRIHRQDKLFRKIISFILKMTILIRHGYYIRDANCPYKIFQRDCLRFLIDWLPENCVVPSIDLEILARKEGMSTVQFPVEHQPYENRQGTLQSLNKKSLTMFWNAFKEVWSIT